MTIEDALRERMLEDDVRIYKLAEQAGVNRCQLHSFLRGKSGLRLATASKVCEVLGMELKSRKRRRRK